MPSKDQVFVANTNATVQLDPNDDSSFVAIYKDTTRVRGDDSLVKKFPGLFNQAEVSVDVEAATANPGEKRGEKPA